MKKLNGNAVALAAAVAAGLVGGAYAAHGADRSAMSDAYWRIWNDAEQARIDADIDRNRKADAHVAVSAADGSEVTVEQVGHEFRFGAHIFNFDQLGSEERNDAYKAMYGAGGLFNQATVSFYWIDYEPTPGAFRADGDYRDTERYWNAMTFDEARKDRFWRRPAPGPVIDFLKAKDVAVHGHCLVWGNAKPYWIYDWLCPEGEKRAFDSIGIPRHSSAFGREPAGNNWVGYHGQAVAAWGRAFADPRNDERALAAKSPAYAKAYREAFRRRVEGVAARFGAFVDSWDVVNESAIDWRRYRKARTGLPYWLSSYGLMPGDYPLRAMLDAKAAMPPEAKLAINDYDVSEDYVDEVSGLAREGAKIDLVGVQMHIFSTNDSMRLASGATNVSWVGTPASIREKLDLLAKAGRPIHVSEVTIAAPGTDARSREIQAVLARNMYRAWFSHPKTMGVTWWNTVDGGGVYGEPLVSGLMTSDLRRKPAYDALDGLVNGEWRTRLTAKAKGGFVDFRGFRGDYRVGWKCSRCGERHVRSVRLGAGGLSEPAAASARAGGCGEFVRRFLVDGVAVEVPEGESALDLAKVYPDGVGFSDGSGEFREGSRWAEVEFDLVAPADGTYRVGVAADWFGQFPLADGRTLTLDGPGAVELPLSKGVNRVRYRSRAGRSGKWSVRVQAIESDAQ